MNISIISGSQRAGSESRRVAEYIRAELGKKEGLGAEVSQVFLKDLYETALPFFDDTLEENEAQQALWKPVAEELSQSDAFVFITPEWNGMASPALKNLLLYVDMELAHKPALLVSVTSGMFNGAYPIAELRANSSKNTYVNYIPNHVIVRNAEKCFVGEAAAEDNKSDQVARKRLNFSLRSLLLYAKALGEMRKTSTIDWEEFANGM